MNMSQGEKYIRSFAHLGSRPGLGRISELLRLMGDPHKNIRFVHVAGTNGKGSFCAMLSSVLAEAGINVGCFSTPPMMSYTDCITLSGRPVSTDLFDECAGFAADFSEKMADHPTEYELLTATAFEIFRRSGCGTVVLECCMGGSGDVTNVIDAPMLAVITDVALDHTAFLGATVREIAQNKSGIIKPGCEVLFCGSDPDARDVVGLAAVSNGCVLHYPMPWIVSNAHSDLRGNTFIYGNLSFSTTLLGSYQINNAVSVIKAAMILGSLGMDITAEHIRAGIAKAYLPARFEMLSAEGPVIFDGAHNPQGADAFVKAYRAVTDKKCILVSGIMGDKDHASVASILAPISDFVFTCAPDNPRSLDPEVYAREFSVLGVAADPCENVSEAVEKARAMSKEKRLPLCIVGSLYLYKSVKCLFS